MAPGGTLEAACWMVRQGSACDPDAESCPSTATQNARPVAWDELPERVTKAQAVISAITTKAEMTNRPTLPGRTRASSRSGLKGSMHRDPMPSGTSKLWQPSRWIAPHEPDVRAPAGGILLNDGSEPEALVVVGVGGLGCLQPGRDPQAVGAFQTVSHQRAAEAF